MTSEHLKQKRREWGQRYRARLRMRRLNGEAPATSSVRPDGLLRAHSDEMMSYLEALTPMEVHTSDGRVIHTSLKEVDNVLAECRRERKRRRRSRA